jgi:hypothetical protein
MKEKKFLNIINLFFFILINYYFFILILFSKKYPNQIFVEYYTHKIRRMQFQGDLIKLILVSTYFKEYMVLILNKLPKI